MTPAQNVQATILGFPRIGPDRELKKAVEGYWSGRLDAVDLASIGQNLRRGVVKELAAAGLDVVPTGSFSWYDHVLDNAGMTGAVDLPVGLETGAWFDAYFGLARGNANRPPLEMTKWFDTNYHYSVPEIGPNTPLRSVLAPALRDLKETTEAGVTARPVLLGPLTLLLLAKAPADAPAGFTPLDRLHDLLRVYSKALAALAEAGAEWVQLDEPALVRDLTKDQVQAIGTTYKTLAALPDRPKILVATYFDSPYAGPHGDALAALVGTPVEGLALDFVAGAEGLRRLAALGGLPGRTLVAGLIDGRNVWRADLRAVLSTASQLLPLCGELVISTSCSLLHVPVDLNAETRLDGEVRGWTAFARQKVAEVVAIARALREGPAVIADELAASDLAVRSRATSARITDPAVRARLAALTDADRRRPAEFAARAKVQQEKLGLPPLPTTTIGSFPQTAEVRGARARLVSGALDEAGYTALMRAEIDRAIAVQEAVGIDVLVHGEPERNDMVQCFAELLDGYASTDHGWVQSYGTRCVRPPLLYGDVSRPTPMTVEWARYASSRTSKPVKGMLTGPVTMLKWSFVRDDQPLGVTADSVALALRDEVADLEAAGVAIIQVDEPALREALPLRAIRHAEYLAWATGSFRLATARVADSTQIHTHMCYSEFGDVIGAIADLDADVTTIEAARSAMEVLDDLRAAGFAAGVGPGVYDIHTTRVPSEDDVVKLLHAALAATDVDRLWVNPDCGLKTRGYAEVEPALTAMVAAAKRVRAELAG